MTKVFPPDPTSTNSPCPKPPPSSSNTPSTPDDQPAVEILATYHSVEVIGNPQEVIQALPAPSPPPAPVLQEQNESDPEWPVQAESEEEDADEEEELSSEGQAACGKRKRPLFLPGEVERELGEWLQQNTFLYDRGLADYKNTVKKKKKNPSLKRKGLIRLRANSSHVHEHKFMICIHNSQQDHRRELLVTIVRSVNN